MISSLEKITRDGRAFFLAYDHGMEHGTADFNQRSVDPEKILELAESGYFTGVIFQKGVAEKYYRPGINRVPLIIKLNGKTSLAADPEPYSPLLCSVEEAVSLGASALGYTIYIGSRYESQMMKEFSQVEQEADKRGLPLIAWMYPRGKAVLGKEFSPEVLSYAARVALELGAEMAKIPYTGDPESFSWVVKAAGKVKVVVQGGPKVKEGDFLKMVQDILTAGASGAVVGRNIWQAEDPLLMAEKVAKTLWGEGKA
ncbi:aldolase [Candidatus Shapirobacteria bacterium]|nr:aldolase [Candidatus Shapirobacteria bacterium]